MKRYSRNVDIKVINTTGVVYSRFNVNLDDSRFTITKQETDGEGLFYLVILVGTIILCILALNDIE
jgi:hypothetical protein